MLQALRYDNASLLCCTPNVSRHETLNSIQYDTAFLPEVKAKRASSSKLEAVLCALPRDGGPSSSPRLFCCVLGPTAGGTADLLRTLRSSGSYATPGGAGCGIVLALTGALCHDEVAELAGVCSAGFAVGGAPSACSPCLPSRLASSVLGAEPPTDPLSAANLTRLVAGALASPDALGSAPWRSYPTPASSVANPPSMGLRWNRSLFSAEVKCA